MAGWTQTGIKLWSNFNGW